MSEENVKRVINTFENADSASYHNQNDQYSAQPMLKKWNEQMNDLDSLNTNSLNISNMTLGIMQPYFMPYIGYWQQIGKNK